MKTKQYLDDGLRRIKSISMESSYENEIIQFLSNVNQEYATNEPQWEYYHGRLSGMASRKIMEMENYINLDIEDEIGHTLDGDVSFSIYVCMVKRLIQKEETQNLARVYEEHSDSFVDVPLNAHISALCLRALEGPRLKVLQFCLDAIDAHDMHPGALHHMGLVIVERFENDYETIRDDDFPDTKEGLLRYAEDQVRKAIECESEYAMYHSTLGRILAASGRFEASRSALETAIQLEDISKQDGQIRVSKYHRSLTEVDIEEQRKEFEQTQSKIDNAEEKIQEFQSRTLEFLGFFAALLTVAVSSISITTAYPFHLAAQLILILIGGIMVAFAGLGFVLPRRRDNDDHLTPLLVGGAGVLLILIGLVAGTVLSFLNAVAIT